MVSVIDAVQIVSADGKVKRELEPTEYTLSRDTAPSVSPDYTDPSWETTELFPEKPESFEFTVTAKDGKTAKVSMGLIGETDITREMVNSMLLEENHEPALSFADGHLRIPDIIYYQGRVLKVVGIGPGAFKDFCDGTRQWNLKSIEFPESLRWIKAEAFAGAGRTEVSGPTPSMWFDLPDSVEAIGSYAFSNFGRDIANVSMGNSLKYLGDGLFNGSTYAGNLNIPGSLKTFRMSSLGNGSADGIPSHYSVATFSGNINIGEGMKEIISGDQRDTAGRNHINLRHGYGLITVPSTVKSIESGAFSGVFLDGLLTGGMAVRVNQPKDALQGAPWGIHNERGMNLDPDVVTWNS